MRLHRLLGIIMLLESRGTMTAKTLANILETSERTIYRDIDILCESGLPIHSISGPNGGFSFMKNYKINSNVLKSGDALHLLLSSMGIRAEKDTEMNQQLKNALIKLENSVPTEHKDVILKAKERFFIDLDPWWGKRVQMKNVDIIKKSVLDLKKLKVCYKKYNGEVSERILRPYGVVIKNSEWYVIAFCQLKNDIRVFMCNRIEHIEVLEESFTISDDFSLELFWESSKRQFEKKKTPNIPHNTYPVKLKFNQEKKQLLEGFNVQDSYKEGDTWIYIIDLISFQTASNVVFPLSDRINVLEPVELRHFITEKCNKILFLYKNI
jgi:predicted DNA-binding transcriptional regulator YafY